MRVAEALGHERQLEGLWRAARAGRLAHALGFFGPAGIGKYLCAERLAVGLVCAHGPAAPCLVCGPCKRAASGAHPDLFAIDPLAEEEEAIKLERIADREGGGRSLEDFLSLRPMENGWRIALIREADRMNEAAQNALLKTLEEPGAQTLLVLESARVERMLPTLRSRLVAVQFQVLPRESVEDVLHAHAEELELERASIPTLARMARGAPGAAIALARQQALLQRALLVNVLTGVAHVHEASAALGELDGKFPGKTPAARERARTRSILDLLSALLCDARRALEGLASSDLAHGDVTPRLGGLSRATLARALEHTLEARQDVELNLNPETALERALLSACPSKGSAGPSNGPHARTAGARVSSRNTSSESR